MTDIVCPLCFKRIIQNYKVDSSATVVYLNKEVHPSCALKYIINISKGPRPDKLGIS